MELRSLRSLSNPLLPVRLRVFYQERVYCGPCLSPDGQTHERAPDLVRHPASRDLPPLHTGDRPLRKGAAALRDPRVRVGFRRGDDGLPGLQYALPAHAQLGDEREDRQLFHRGRGGARGRGVLEGPGPALDLLCRLPSAPPERVDGVRWGDGRYRLRLGPRVRPSPPPRPFLPPAVPPR